MSRLILNKETAAQNKLLYLCKRDHWFMLVTLVKGYYCKGIHLDSFEETTLYYDEMEDTYCEPASSEQVRRHLATKLETLNSTARIAIEERDDFTARMAKFMIETTFP